MEGVAPATSGHPLVSAVAEIQSKHISPSYFYCSMTELKVILTSSHMTRKQTVMKIHANRKKPLFLLLLSSSWSVQTLRSASSPSQRHSELQEGHPSGTEVSRLD